MLYCIATTVLALPEEVVPKQVHQHTYATRAWFDAQGINPWHFVFAGRRWHRLAHRRAARSRPEGGSSPLQDRDIFSGQRQARSAAGLARCGVAGAAMTPASRLQRLELAIVGWFLKPALELSATVGFWQFMMMCLLWVFLPASWAERVLRRPPNHAAT